MSQEDNIGDPFSRIACALSTQGWCVAESVQPIEDIDCLRNEAQRAWSEGSFKAAAVGRGRSTLTQRTLRGDDIRWLDDTSPQSARCLAWFEQLRLAINRECFLGLFDFEAHFARYAAGARYAKHLDRFQDDSARVVSCVFYLNPDWRADDGGQLRVYLGGETQQHIDIYPHAGTLVTFLSDRFAHEVLPAVRERWSVAGWFRTRVESSVV